MSSVPVSTQPSRGSGGIGARLLHGRFLIESHGHVSSRSSRQISSSLARLVMFVCVFRFIINDQETFFSQAQRSLMVYEILLRARYEDSREKFGIDRLVKSQTYLAAFPLHDVSCILRNLKDEVRS